MAEIEPKDGGRGGEVGEGEEAFLVGATAGEGRGVADAGQLHGGEQLAGAVVELDAALGVGDVAGDEGVVHHGDLLEVVARLGEDDLPGGALGVEEIDGDDAAVWGVSVGVEPERVGVGGDGRVAGVGGGGDLDEGRGLRLAEVGVAQVERGEGIFVALAGAEQQIAAVVGGVGADEQFLVVGSLVDDGVGGLAGYRVCGRRPYGRTAPA